jgi:hypothetical protein
MKYFILLLVIFLCRCLEYLKNKSIKIRPKSDVVRLVEINRMEEVNKQFKELIVIFYFEMCFNW